MAQKHSYGSMKMRNYISGAGYTAALNTFFSTVENDPTFNTGLNWNDYANMTLDEYRLLQTKRARSLTDYQFIENDNIMDNPAAVSAYVNGMLYLEWSSGMKYFLNRSVF